MYPQAQTTTTAQPIFSRIGSPHSKPKARSTREIKMAQAAPLTLNEEAYRRMAQYICEHSVNEYNNRYSCELEGVDIDLECGSVVELNGSVEYKTDYSYNEWLANGDTGQVVECTCRIKATVYNEDGEIIPSDFNTKDLEDFIY